MSARACTPFGEKQEPFKFDKWKFISKKRHILTSNEVDSLSEKLALPQLPEMTFGANKFEMQHDMGFAIHFNAVDALALVDNKKDLMKVAMAKEWAESRKGNEYISQTVKPFDWTYTTNYKGTLTDPNHIVTVSETSEKIDLERLKKREKILYFEEMMLFEDELADNGSAQLTVKIRVMTSCFFLLMRFFLRVDGVLSRIYDTRWYHEFGKSYLIREYSEKEKSFSQMKGISPATLTDPNLLDGHLTTQKRVVEKIDFSGTSGTSEATKSSKNETVSKTDVSESNCATKTVVSEPK
ncbi:TIP41-like protein [Ciona intestinalis]